MRKFPAERLPDGELFAPHHYIYSTLASLVPIMVVWDNYPYTEPVLTLVLIGLSLFGWFFFWKHYPKTGAILSLGGNVLAIASVALGIGWTQYDAAYRVVTAILLLVALDDVFNHVTGITTPLDTLWKSGMYKFFS